MTLSGVGRLEALGAVLVAVVLAYAAAYAPLIAVAALGAIVLVFWIVTRAELILFVLVAAIPWEAMLEFPSATISVVKLLGLALVTAYLFRAFTRAEELRPSPILAAAAALGIFIALSLLVSDDPALGLPKSLRYAFFLLFLFLVTQLVETVDTAWRLVRVFVLSTTVAALYGLFGFLSGSTERAAGPLHDANDFAYLIATVIPLAAALMIDDRRRRGLWVAALAILLAATLATLSRGAMVGLGALVVWAIASRRVGAGGLAAGALVVATVLTLAITLWSSLIHERVERKERIGEKNVASRMAFWSAAGMMALEDPVLGVGPDRFGQEADRYLRNNPLSIPDPVVHNTYLELLAENGIFALIAFLALLGGGWRSASRAESTARDLHDERAARLAAAVKGTLIVAIVSGLFLSEQLTLPFWLACGLAGSGALWVAGAPSVRRHTSPAVALR